MKEIANKHEKTYSKMNILKYVEFGSKPID